MQTAELGGLYEEFIQSPVYKDLMGFLNAHKDYTFSQFLINPNKRSESDDELRGKLKMLQSVYELVSLRVEEGKSARTQLNKQSKT